MPLQPSPKTAEPAAQEWAPGLRPLPWPLWEGPPARARSAAHVGAAWALTAAAAVLLTLLSAKTPWLLYPVAGWYVGLDPSWALALLWALWAGWAYGLAITALSTLALLLVVGERFGPPESLLVIADSTGILFFFLFLSAFPPDPRIRRLRDVALFVAGSFLAATAAACVAQGWVGLRQRPQGEVALFWVGWWVGRFAESALVALPLAAICGDWVERWKRRSFNPGRLIEDFRRQMAVTAIALVALIAFFTTWIQAANAPLEGALARGTMEETTRRHLAEAQRFTAVYQGLAVAVLLGLLASGLVFWLVLRKRYAEQLARELESRTEALRRRQLQLAALQSVSEATARSLVPEAVASQIAEHMAHTFEPAAVAIYLRDPFEEGILDRVALSASAEAAVVTEVPRRLPIDGSLVGHVLQKGETVVVEKDLARHPFSLAFTDLMRQWKAQAFIGIPIAGERTPLGVIQILLDQPHEADEEEQRLYRLIGRTAGTALERAHAHAMARRRAEILDALYHVTQELGTESEALPLLRCAARAARHVLEADCAVAVLTRHEAGSRLCLKVAAVSGQPEGEVPFPGWEFELNDPGLVAETVRDGRTRSAGLRPAPPQPTALAAGWRASVAIVAPLLSRPEELAGALVLTFAPSQRVGPEEMGIAEEIARQAGAGLRRARLLEETRRQAADLALFDQIGRALSERLSITETLSRLVHQVSKVFPAQVVGVLDHDAKAEALVLRVTNVSSPEAKGLRLPLSSQSLAVTTFKLGRSFMSSDMRQDPRADPELCAHFNNVSGVFVPLGAAGSPLGVLFALNSFPREFSADEIRRLEQIASLASAALERARLYEEVHERANELMLLNEAAGVLVETPLLETSLRRISGLVREHFAAAGAGFLLAGRGAEELVAVGVSGLHADALHELRLPFKGPGTVQTAFRTQQPVAAADLQTGEERNTVFARLLPGVHSVVAVPMLASKGPLGILMVYTEKPRTFNDQDLRRLTGVARLAAAAVERGELGQALRATEARLQEILDGIPAVVISLDLEGRILSFNATAESVTGWRRDEVLGRGALSLLLRDPEARRRLRAVFRQTLDQGGQARDVLSKLHRRDGPERQIRWSSKPLRNPDGSLSGVVAMGLDVTEQMQLEAQFLQAQKMESVGALAGGMAHGFNNLLGGILGQASLLRAQLAPDDIRQETVAKIESAAQRGADLNRKLMAFARKSVLQPMPVDVGALIHETTELLGGSIPRHIAVKAEVQPGLPPVLGDATQLQQVLLNLCVNARDAMARGGTLTLRARPAPHGGVELEIEDTGTGMDAEVKEHLFEPFYTTKEPGKGTGLGLAVVFGIVRSHGGTVEADSEPGRGTRFRIYLPAQPSGAVAPQSPARPELASAESVPLPEALVGKEEILVIDDEPMLRDTCHQLLSGLGYHVRTASDGLAALDLLDRAGYRPRLVILDVVMPGLSGVPLLKEIQKRLPSVPVILISGYYRDATGRELLAAGARQLVPKPFRIEDLAGAMRRALDAK